ncbi:molybdopterin converting factor subunit 1 [Saccharibacillus kuerlensis]|uniref:Molybdopterin synthase sulfur carrier subunit n=1 Tax=Saccharibacillus kuerlensis TaxID=459527 RepID=A0ABQ2L438_9BACL|nr:molybdopterin converting factor subunit 1 [Saccharibacillus kuerlensis]GGO02019.1 molybdopterin synthase sulfur carrier subunit [Saccharibacillus kuerlensis]
MITIFYFAGLREATGTDREEADLAGKTIQELSAWVNSKYPHLSLDAVRVAINEEYALSEDVLQDGDTAALIPPVSGG